MRLTKRHLALASICIVGSSALRAVAEEDSGTDLETGSVQAGVYDVVGNTAAEVITVADSQACVSKSSGDGIVVRPPFSTGIVCLSRQGFAYVKKDAPFAQSSLTQNIQPGVYGSDTPFADGNRQEIVVLPDKRECVFNPTFDKSHTWTGNADDGRSNRRGLTIVGTHSDLTCLSTENVDMAFFDPQSGKSYLLTAPYGQKAYPKSADVLRELAQQIIDAINPSDDQSYHHKKLPLAKRTVFPLRGPARMSGVRKIRAAGQTESSLMNLLRVKLDHSGREVGSAYGGAIWAGEITDSTTQSQCDPILCAGIANCVPGDGAPPQCSTADTINTDIYDADYDIDVAAVTLPAQAKCESQSGTVTYFAYGSAWGGIGGFDQSTLLQSGVDVYYQCKKGKWGGRNEYIWTEDIGPGNFDKQARSLCPNAADSSFSGNSLANSPDYTSGFVSISDSAASSCAITKNLDAAPDTAFGGTAEGIYERLQLTANAGINDYEEVLSSGTAPFITITYDATGAAYGYFFNPSDSGQPVNFNITGQPIAADYTWSYQGQTYDVSFYQSAYANVDQCDSLIGSASKSSVSNAYSFEGSASSKGDCYLNSAAKHGPVVPSLDLLSIFDSSILLSGITK
jgi:hypothetical protein